MVTSVGISLRNEGQMGWTVTVSGVILLYQNAYDENIRTAGHYIYFFLLFIFQWSAGVPHLTAYFRCKGKIQYCVLGCISRNTFSV